MWGGWCCVVVWLGVVCGVAGVGVCGVSVLVRAGVRDALGRGLFRVGRGLRCCRGYAVRSAYRRRLPVMPIAIRFICSIVSSRRMLARPLNSIS